MKHLRRLPLFLIYAGLAWRLFVGLRYDGDAPNLMEIDEWTWRAVPYIFSYIVIYLIPFLTIVFVIHAIIAVFIKRWRTWSLAVVFISIGAILFSLWQFDFSWRLIPAYFFDYSYEPGSHKVDTKLLYSPPEWILTPFLEDLIGKTGAVPLDSDSPLVAFSFHDVQITNWRNVRPIATVKTEFHFADGSSHFEYLTLFSPNQYHDVIFIDTLFLAVIQWIPDSNLLSVLSLLPDQAPEFSNTPSPIKLTAQYSLVASQLAEHLSHSGNSLSIEDIDSRGNVLAGVWLGNGSTSAGQLLQYVTADGSAVDLHWTGRSLRDAQFAPDGEQIGFRETHQEAFPGETADVVWMGTVGGGFEEIVSAESFTFANHDNEMLFSYRNDEGLFTYSDGDSTELDPQFIDDLYPISQSASGPIEGQLAFVDTAGRLWLSDLKEKTQKQIGWAYRPNLIWRDDGRMLSWNESYSADSGSYNKLSVYDVENDELFHLTRGYAKFTPLCWLESRYLLVVAERPDHALLLFDVDSAETWQLPQQAPYEDGTICTNGFVARRDSHSVSTIYKIENNSP